MGCTWLLQCSVRRGGLLLILPCVEQMHLLLNIPYRIQLLRSAWHVVLRQVRHMCSNGCSRHRRRCSPVSGGRRRGGCVVLTNNTCSIFRLAVAVAVAVAFAVAAPRPVTITRQRMQCCSRVCAALNAQCGTGLNAQRMFSAPPVFDISYYTASRVVAPQVRRMLIAKPFCPRSGAASRCSTLVAISSKKAIVELERKRGWQRWRQ